MKSVSALLKTKKIAWFSDTFEQPNGIARYCQYMPPKLARRVDFTLYTGRVTKNYGFKVHSFPHWKYPLNGDYDLIFPNKRVDADLVHTHTPYLLGLNSLKYDVPKVATAHFLPYHFLEWLFGGNQPDFAVNAGWKYETWFLNHFDRVVCQTHVGKRMFQSKGVKRKIEVIPNGMDLTSYGGNASSARTKYGIKGKFALFVGRIDASKRPDWVIEAAKRLPKFKFVFAGVGAMAEKLEKPSNVLFLNWLSRRDLINLMHASSAVLMPSAVETEGLVAQEAMTCKRPVVISDNEVLREVAGKAGLVSRTVEQFTANVENVLSSSKVEKEYSELSFEQVRTRDINKSIEKLELLYSELLQ